MKGVALSLLFFLLVAGAVAAADLSNACFDISEIPGNCEFIGVKNESAEGAQYTLLYQFKCEKEQPAAVLQYMTIRQSELTPDMIVVENYKNGYLYVLQTGEGRQSPSEYTMLEKKCTYSSNRGAQEKNTAQGGVFPNFVPPEEVQQAQQKSWDTPPSALIVQNSTPLQASQNEQEALANKQLQVQKEQEMAVEGRGASELREFGAHAEQSSAAPNLAKPNSASEGDKGQAASQSPKPNTQSSAPAIGFFARLRTFFVHLFN